MKSTAHDLWLKTENTLNFSKYTTIFFKVYSCNLKFITILWWRHSCSIFITMVKVRLFCWWCCVCCIVLFTLCILILWACHDHNKIAPCGMIKAFWIELNYLAIQIRHFAGSHVEIIFRLFLLRTKWNGKELMEKVPKQWGNMCSCWDTNLSLA